LLLVRFKGGCLTAKIIEYGEKKTVFEPQDANADRPIRRPVGQAVT
jgi:hypothetical protein